MPDVPTFAEQGYELDFRNWLGLFFQAGISKDIVQRWNTDVNKLLGDAKFVAKYLSPMAVTSTGGTPEELAAFLKANRATAAELAKIAKLKLD
jgi:tripartite-type tricarboxylate transporter receptor subunit TctC